MAEIEAPVPSMENMLGINRVLFYRNGVDMNSTADQLLTKFGGFTSFRISAIEVSNASASLTTALGGVYGAPSKAAPALVAASQNYLALTAPDVVMSATLTALGSSRMYTLNNLYFSLTTPQGVAATADIRVLGWAWS